MYTQKKINSDRKQKYITLISLPTIIVLNYFIIYYIRTLQIKFPEYNNRLFWLVSVLVKCSVHTEYEIYS